jgi:nicotinate-nucleotide pyrophosphorylase (carboxylating)
MTTTDRRGATGAPAGPGDDRIEPPTLLPSGIPRPVLVEAVARSLAEDYGRGDLTSEVCIPAHARGKAFLVAREEVVLAGLGVAREVFAQVDPEVRFELAVQDGTLVTPGSVCAQVSGRTRSLLAGERVALNFLQRMTGVATLTRRYVDALPPGSTTRVVDTRKTTPGLRAFERYAVRCGGGFNHREDLGAAVLIKDNHVAAAGGVREAVRRARRMAPHTTRIECEVDDLEQLDRALEAGADVVLLDNFDDDQVREAVRRRGARPVILEVSGGVALGRLPFLGASGVDVVSVGALTHSAPAADLGLDWAPRDPG